MVGPSPQVAEELVVTAEMVSTLLEIGGFVHPLFASDDPSRPLPGQGVLLLLGGMLERSGTLDHAVALLGFDSVRFKTMVRPGDRIRARLELAGGRATSSGARIETFNCTVENQREDVVLVASFQMLVDPAAAASAAGAYRERERNNS